MQAEATPHVRPVGPTAAQLAAAAAQRAVAGRSDGPSPSQPGASSAKARPPRSEISPSPRMKTPLAAVPPPAVPSMEAPALPIAVPSRGGLWLARLARLWRRPRARLAAATLFPAEGEVAVAVASGLRLLLATSVDLTVVLAPGLLVALAEAHLLDDGVRLEGSWFLDYVAGWLHAHGGAALHGAIVSVAFGAAYGGRAAATSGRTVGRMLAGTVLVRSSGKEMRWPLATVRAVMSVVSVAAFGAGYFWSIIDRRGRTLHDLIVGTVVVQRTVS